MKFVEYSTEKLNCECKSWGQEIFKIFRPELIIYIARAGYICAKPIAEIDNIPLLGIGAVRSGNEMKEIMGPLCAYIPMRLRNFLAMLELKSGVHKKNTERDVLFHKSIETINKKSIEKILIIDDAVDTGYSMKKVVEVTMQEFVNAKIKTACLNMSCKEDESVIKIDFVLMRGASVKTPFSKDSKEYIATKKRYLNETNNEYL